MAIWIEERIINEQMLLLCKERKENVCRNLPHWQYIFKLTACDITGPLKGFEKKEEVTDIELPKLYER